MVPAPVIQREAIHQLHFTRAIHRQSNSIHQHSHTHNKAPPCAEQLSVRVLHLVLSNSLSGCFTLCWVTLCLGASPCAEQLSVLVLFIKTTWAMMPCFLKDVHTKTFTSLYSYTFFNYTHRHVPNYVSSPNSISVWEWGLPTFLKNSFRPSISVSVRSRRARSALSLSAYTTSLRINTHQHQNEWTAHTMHNRPLSMV